MNTEDIRDMPQAEPTSGSSNGVHKTLDPARANTILQYPDLLAEIEAKIAARNEQAAAYKPIRKRRALNVRQTTWPEPKWIVPGLLPVGLGVLGGLPKLGKSWLSLQLSYTKASGGSIFGIKVKPGKVWYLALEDPYRRLADRMDKQQWNQEDYPIDFTTIDEGAADIGDMRKGGTDHILEEIAREGYDLVIIDTLSRIIKGDQKERHEVDPILEPLQVGAQRLDCCVLLIDHHRKSVGQLGGDAGDSLMDNSGSVAKAGTVDTGWNLYRKRGELDGKLTITGRDVDEQSLALQFDRDRFIWTSQGNAAQIQMTQRRQEIYDAVFTLKRATMTQISQQTKQEPGNLLPRLNDMVAAGVLNRDGYYYSIREVTQ